MNNNENFTEALEGPTTLYDRSPQKQDEGSVVKVRVRYSGAARRRYKKQLLMEGKAGHLKPIPEPIPKVDLPTGTGEQASMETNKRLCQELSTLSPSEINQPEKRPKTLDQRNFSQIASNIVRVAIVPTTYPDSQLSKEEADELKQLVESHILSLPREIKAPTFKGTSDRDGAVIFNCTDEESDGWLKHLTSEIKLNNGMLLRALRVDELPKRYRVVVHAENPKKPVNEILDLIDRQNPGVGNDWVVAKGSESRDAKSIHFAAFIREETLRALEALNFKPFCGLSQATVRLVVGNRGKDEEKGGELGPIN